MSITRRNFLTYTSLASCSMLMPGFLHGFGRTPPSQNGKKLVIIQLSGGNDGLNTFVPFRHDPYYQQRPRLALSAREVLPVSDELGFHPAFGDMADLFERGEFCLLNQVGYPNPDRSHFRAMDIWHSASPSDEYWQHGWLGRYLDHHCQGKAPHQVVEVDDLLSLAVKGEQAKGLAVTDVRRLHQATRDRHLQALQEHAPPHHQAPGQLAYLYKTLAETSQSVEYLYEHTKTYASRVSYPRQRFAQQLQRVAALICSGLETQVYYLSLSGFDTHVRQQVQQARLLQQYSQGMAAFVEDLRQHHRLSETLIMTFSEFGRRVGQNASDGTDHGKANNLWLIGGQLKQAGMYNPLPDLRELDEGDLPWRIDFRQVYASLLHDWLGADDQQILRGRFHRLPIL